MKRKKITGYILLRFMFDVALFNLKSLFSNLLIVTLTFYVLVHHVSQSRTHVRHPLRRARRVVRGCPAPAGAGDAWRTANSRHAQQPRRRAHALHRRSRNVEDSTRPEHDPRDGRAVDRGVLPLGLPGAQQRELPVADRRADHRPRQPAGPAGDRAAGVRARMGAP